MSDLQPLASDHERQRKDMGCDQAERATVAEFETGEPGNDAEHVSHGLPMDKGTIAWLQVLGSWILYANSWGLSTSFGVFQTYYSNTLLPTYSPSRIAWIGSIQLFLTEFIAGPVGWLIDANYLTYVLIAGMVLEVLGILMLSLCRRYWQIILAQAICTGLGGGFLGVTCSTILPLYFSKKRYLAVGIAATGTSIAGILYPLMLRKLLDTVGFGWAVRVFALIILVTMAVCIAVMKDRPEARKGRRTMFNKTLFRDAPYMAAAIGYALSMASLFIPNFWVEDYGLRLGLNSELSTGLISIINATSLLGRLGPSWLADRYGGMNLIIPCTLLAGVAIFLFKFASVVTSLVAVSAVYGSPSGAIVALIPAIFNNLSREESEHATRMGMAISMAGVASLVAYPISGAAQRPSSNVGREFQGTWYFGGALMIVASIALVIGKHLEYGIFGRERSRLARRGSQA